MDPEKKRKLEAAGWKFGVDEFLNEPMTAEEVYAVDFDDSDDDSDDDDEYDCDTV